MAFVREIHQKGSTINVNIFSFHLTSYFTHFSSFYKFGCNRSLFLIPEAAIDSY
jgi:hypothetical protein